ncbi:hypothetical protein BURKHO8Y_10086 [Burkholderia sp. 8Y]|nr:hypothetical protein BURKHO8Y_10086 [Burkholderia sp. 8Y]
MGYRTLPRQKKDRTAEGLLQGARHALSRKISVVPKDVCRTNATAARAAKASATAAADP